MTRVLVVDDNQLIRESIRKLISPEPGWEVCGEATNGLEAVQMAAKLKPDVVLLDFQMPIMNGLDAAKALIKDNASIPIAMYTLHQNTYFEKEARAAGVRKVISKMDVFSALVPNLRELVTS